MALPTSQAAMVTIAMVMVTVTAKATAIITPTRPTPFEGYEVIKLLYVVDNQLNKLYNLIILKRKRAF